MKTSSIHIDRRELQTIGEIADRRGVRACVVGGFVRDLLLGKEGNDIDVVVEADGISFAEEVARAFRHKKIVRFEKFGTAVLNLAETTIEFVGARKESYVRSSRKPEVQRGSIEEDLSRRDFTINAIGASLNKKDRGSILDPFNGRKDLAKKIIRTPLDPRSTFDDDPLRIMRAMRFASQLGFDIEKNVVKAAGDMRSRLEIVSKERIADEFLKILASPKPSVGLMLMQDTGVLAVVFPEVAQLAGVDQREEYHHKDVFLHTLKVLDNVAEVSVDIWLRAAALLHDIAKPRTKAFRQGIGWTFHGHEEIGARMVKSIFMRMKFPLTPVKRVEKLVRLHLRPMALVDDIVTDSALRRLLFDAGEQIDDLMLLCRADITSKNPRLVAKVKGNYAKVVEKMKEVEERDRLRNWQPPLDGLEIMELFGLDPGPAVGKLKTAVREAILEGHIPNDHQAALEYLIKRKDEILRP